MKRRGVALITVLIMTAILSMMLIALYASVRGGLLSATTNSKRVAARYVAEAGLVEAMDNLQAGGYAQTTGQISGSLSSGGTWVVDFNDSPPFGIYDSVNNLNNAIGAAESHHGPNSVSSNTALLIVRGEVGGIQSVVEAVVTRGGGSIATGNAIQGTGGVKIAGDLEVDGLSTLSDSTPAPASIHSNAAAGVGVEWDNSGGAIASISGTVTSAGGTINLSGYTPGGGAPSTSTPAPFPNIDIQGTIAGKSGSPAPPTGGGSISLVSQDYYQSGDLVINGDLELNGSSLHVDGNLIVNGSISGDGSVFVAGETNFYGDANVSTNSADKVALLSHGSVKLSGFNGTQYLESIADTTFQTRFSNLQTTLQDMQTMMGSNPVSSLVQGGANKVTVDQMRRAIGQTAAGATYNGYEVNLTVKLADFLATQPAGPSRDFLVKKLNSVGNLFEGVDKNPLVVGLPNDNVMRQIIIDEWLNNPGVRNLDHIGMFDAVIDNGETALMNEMINLTNQLDYDKLGSSYFQGLVYTKGFVHANNEVNIVGAIMANGDSSNPTTTINGTPAAPGDLILENGVKVTFVEDFFDGQAGSINIGGAGTLGVQTWLGR